MLISEYDDLVYWLQEQRDLYKIPLHVSRPALLKAIEFAGVPSFKVAELDRRIKKAGLSRVRKKSVKPPHRDSHGRFVKKKLIKKLAFKV